jgi:phosphatidate cytidylyltransferase
MGLAMLVLQYEFYRMSVLLGAKPQWFLGMLASAVAFFAAFANSYVLWGEAVDYILWYLLVPIGTLIFFVELYRKSATVVNNIAHTLMGVMYIGVPFAVSNVIMKYEFGATFMLCFFLMLWANDTFAYLFGIMLGKHKLFPSISPKKSWEGYFGGIISVVGVAYLLHLAFEGTQFVHIAAIGLIVAITGVFGDLVESMIKRNAGVKDSGSIMPGHGGLLDRFDAVLLSLPLVFAYVQIFVVE